LPSRPGAARGDGGLEAGLPGAAAKRRFGRAARGRAF